MTTPQPPSANRLRFRAWNNTTKEMDNNGEYNLERFFAIHTSVGSDSVIMQSTGLLDKNGKEIFEGDILRFLDGGIIEDKNGIRTSRSDFVVRWEDCLSGSGDYDDWCASGFRFDHDLKECFVVGNVLENSNFPF